MYPSVVYIPPHRPALRLSNSKLTFRKECIPVGDYEKGDLQFSVDEDLIDHWISTFDDMQMDGIPVPMPLNHTEDPEKRRATVLKLEKDINSDGLPSLYAIYNFKNEQAASDLKDADVSIYVPLEFKNGVGKTYRYPIRHIAFTDYPVIPKLEKAVPIAASYVEVDLQKEKGKGKMAKFGKPKEEEEKKEDKGNEFEKGEEHEREVDNEAEGKEDEEYNENENEEGGEVTIDMVRELAEKLGLPCGDEEGSIPDSKLWQAINAVVDALVEEIENSDEGGHEEENENNSGEKGVGAVAHRIEHKEEHYHPPGGSQPIAAGFISIGRKSRVTEINAAAKDGYITPATRDDLIRDYCSEEALQLAFSPEGDILDNFDKEMARIRKNGKVVRLNDEKSQNDALQLSYSEVFTKENNPLLRDAANRAKAVGQG